jgi:hypothetical protein
MHYEYKNLASTSIELTFIHTLRYQHLDFVLWEPFSICSAFEGKNESHSCTYREIKVHLAGYKSSRWDMKFSS